MSLRFRDLWGGGYPPPPPAGSKLAQTPAGARVKTRSLSGVRQLEGVLQVSGNCVMQFPGDVIPWFILMLAFLRIRPTQGQFHLCYDQDNQEKCYLGIFDPPILTLPEKICSMNDCTNPDDCQSCPQCSVTNWATFAQYENRLYNSSHLI